MWVRSCGLQLRRPVPGVLREWWLTSVGDWVGLVDLTVEIDHQQVPMTLLVPAGALTVSGAAVAPEDAGRGSRTAPGQASP